MRAESCFQLARAFHVQVHSQHFTVDAIELVAHSLQFL